MKELYQIPKAEVCVLLGQDILMLSGLSMAGDAPTIHYDDLTKTRL